MSGPSIVASPAALFSSHLISPAVWFVARVVDPGTAAAAAAIACWSHRTRLLAGARAGVPSTGVRGAAAPRHRPRPSPRPRASAGALLTRLELSVPTGTASHPGTLTASLPRPRAPAGGPAVSRPLAQRRPRAGQRWPRKRWQQPPRLSTAPATVSVSAAAGVSCAIVPRVDHAPH